MSRPIQVAVEGATMSAMTIAEYERLNPTVTVRVDGAEIVFHTPNSVTVARARTLMTKEPETIAWINGFRAGDVLVDVGANVGIYSIWAAKTRSAKVVAFEPESQNYAILNRNIVGNRISHLVTAYCAALSDESRFDRLFLSGPDAGGSCHAFGEQLDFRLQPSRFPMAQGCFSTTLDSLLEQGTLQPPNHIKIDVDGLEHKVLTGAAKSLQHPALRSVLVEINTNLDEHREIVARMARYGFRHSEEQAAESRVVGGPFDGLSNYIFAR